MTQDEGKWWEAKRSVKNYWFIIKDYTEVRKIIWDFFSSINALIESCAKIYEVSASATPDDAPRVFCIGTVDTKLEEIRFLAESIWSNLNNISNTYSTTKLQVTIVNVFYPPNEIDSVGNFIFVPKKYIFSCYFGSMEQISCPLPNDRGKWIPKGLGSPIYKGS